MKKNSVPSAFASKPLEAGMMSRVSSKRISVDRALNADPLSTDAATCTWSVQEGDAGGTIDAGGHYVTPDGSGTFHVVASHGSRVATAAVRVLAPGEVGPSSSRQTARQLGSTTAPNGFDEYLPPSYDGSVATPLLIFWHGVGENGNGTTDLPRVRVLFVADHDPIFAAGPDSFFGPLLETAGAENVIDTGSWVQLDREQVVQLAPEAILETGTTPGGERAWSELVSIPAVRDGQIHTIVSHAIARPGPGVPEAVWEIAERLHPAQIRR